MKVAHIAKWGWVDSMSDFNHRFGHSRAERLELVDRLQGLINKGAQGFRTRKDLERIAAIKAELDKDK